MVVSPRGAASAAAALVRYDVGNVYNTAYTMACRLEKKWLTDGLKEVLLGPGGLYEAL